MEGGGGGGQPPRSVGQLTDGGCATQRIGGELEQPVIRTDEDVTSLGLDADRPAFRADARIDDGNVDADRHERQRGPQDHGSVADRVLGHGVRHIDDPGGGADIEHDAAAGRGRAVEAEVGQERDERWSLGGHAHNASGQRE